MPQKIWRRAVNGTWVLVGDQDEIPLMDARLDVLEARRNVWNTQWGNLLLRRNTELLRDAGTDRYTVSIAPYGLDNPETVTWVEGRRYRISRLCRAYGVDAGSGAVSYATFRMHFNGVNYLTGMGDIWHAKANAIAWNSFYLEWIVDCVAGTPMTGAENNIPPGTYTFQIVIHNIGGQSSSQWFWTNGSNLRVDDIGPITQIPPNPVTPLP